MFSGIWWTWPSASTSQLKSLLKSCFHHCSPVIFFFLCHSCSWQLDGSVCINNKYTLLWWNTLYGPVLKGTLDENLWSHAFCVCLWSLWAQRLSLFIFMVHKFLVFYPTVLTCMSVRAEGVTSYVDMLSQNIFTVAKKLDNATLMTFICTCTWLINVRLL